MTEDGRAGVVLLDLGGVLIHVHFERALAHWAACAGLEHDALNGRFTPDEAYERHERGELDFAAYAAHLRKLIGADLSGNVAGARRAGLMAWQVTGPHEIARILEEQTGIS